MIDDTPLSARLYRNGGVPKLRIGPGALEELPRLLEQIGVQRICLVTGKGSYEQLPGELRAESVLREAGFTLRRYSVSGEPSPERVDQIRDAALAEALEAVVAVGGGSVLDTGKATAAMLRHEGSVADYLEGVGRYAPAGRRAPFIALPTTAGTGSEATNNAVLSRTGPGGFKKSLRHDAFVPDAALLDPRLSLHCPPEITAASGLDAITQLLEAYVSTAASPFTSLCAREGLARAGRWFERAVTDGAELEARGQMAYAAYLSGLALASAGLGLVHGAAGVLGGVRSIPHGVACGTLLPEATGRIIRRLRERAGQTAGRESGQTAGRESGPPGQAPAEADEGGAQAALRRYLDAAELLAGSGDEPRETKVRGADERGTDEGVKRLLARLEGWVACCEIPSLGDYGFTTQELEAAAAKVGMKKSPAALSRDEVRSMLLARL